MGTTHQTLLEQLRISKMEISRRKEYFVLRAEDIKLLSDLYPLITAHIEPIVERFYEGILPFHEIDSLIGDADTLIKLRNHQRGYILSLFGGRYDEEYVLSRLRIGLVHKRIGVAPKYYVSTVRNLGRELRAMVLAEHGTNTELALQELEAIDKILLFDLALFFDTYIHSLMDEIRRSKEELEKYTESLEKIVEERTRLLQEQARHDGLTGLINQHYFYKELRKELARGHRRGYSTALIYFDIDGFKHLNDTRGHPVGDQLLVSIAEVLKQSLRKGEVAARYGGDEFCIIMPDSTVEEAEMLSRRVCEGIRKEAADYEISCSVGIAVSTAAHPLDEASLVKYADRAMYTAKHAPGYTIELAEYLNDPEWGQNRACPLPAPSPKKP